MSITQTNFTKNAPGTDRPAEKASPSKPAPNKSTQNKPAFPEKSAPRTSVPGKPAGQSFGKPSDKNPSDPNIMRLERQKKTLSDKLERLKKNTKLACRVVTAFVEKTAALDPNDDPQKLFSQVRPLLAKMGLANLTQANKTELIMGLTQGLNSQYKISLRRDTEIDTNILDRVKRNEKNFDRLVWTSESMCLYIWWPYQADVATEPAGI